MTLTKQLLTFEEYLNYDDGKDKRYELVAGELVEMPQESWINTLISRFLFSEFLKFVDIARLPHKDVEVAVSGFRATVRLPNFMVLSEELVEILRETKRSIITLDMPPPDLIVEVVSPGKANADRDYRYKRSEYAARGISEYWAIDPEQEKITVFTLVDGFYEVAEYTEEMLIQTQCQELQLTAKQVLNYKR